MYTRAYMCVCVCARAREGKIFSTEFLCYEKLFVGTLIHCVSISSAFSIYIEIIDINVAFRFLQLSYL
jgi:hypothetical protein